MIIPIFQSIWISFYEWDGLGPKTWIGLDNYRELLDDDSFYTSLKNNIIWLVLYMLAIPAGLAVALFLNQTVAGIRLYKSLFFFPFVISQVVVGLIFSWFYAPDFGLLPKIIGAITGTEVAILADERYATYGIIAAGLWPQIAYCMILYLTGLNNINPEQVEAARMDNAKGWSMLWHIIIPQLRPATFIAVVVTVIGALRSFDLVSIMTVGGPYGSTRVLSYFMYEQALSEYGVAHGLWRGHRGGALRHHAGLHHALHRPHAGAGKERLMFPTPIPATSPWVQRSYKVAAAFALIVWLLPLIGVAVTSIRPSSDLAAETIRHALRLRRHRELHGRLQEQQHRLLHPQLLQGDDPHGDRRRGAVLPHRLCPGGLQVQGQPAGVLHVRRRQFRALPDPDVPVRDLTLQLGMYNTTYGAGDVPRRLPDGFCTLFMRNFIKGLPFALIEAARVEGVSEWKIFWYIVCR